MYYSKLMKRIRIRGRFSPFAWLLAVKPFHENGTELCRQLSMPSKTKRTKMTKMTQLRKMTKRSKMTIALEDDQALEYDLELTRGGYVVVLNEVEPSHRQNLAQCDVRTIIAKFLLEDDHVILFLQAEHMRGLSDPDLGCRQEHSQRKRAAHENTVRIAATRRRAAVLVHLDFLAVDVHRTPEVVLECTTPIRVESGCEEHRLLPECHIPSIFREWVPPLGMW